MYKFHKMPEFGRLSISILDLWMNQTKRAPVELSKCRYGHSALSQLRVTHTLWTVEIVNLSQPADEQRRVIAKANDRGPQSAGAGPQPPGRAGALTDGTGSTGTLDGRQDRA